MATGPDQRAAHYYLDSLEPTLCDGCEVPRNFPLLPGPSLLLLKSENLPFSLLGMQWTKTPAVCQPFSRKVSLGEAFPPKGRYDFGLKSGTVGFS